MTLAFLLSFEEEMCFNCKSHLRTQTNCPARLHIKELYFVFGHRILKNSTAVKVVRIQKDFLNLSL